MLRWAPRRAAHRRRAPTPRRRGLLLAIAVLVVVAGVAYASTRLDHATTGRAPTAAGVRHAGPGPSPANAPAPVASQRLTATTRAPTTPSAPVTSAPVTSAPVTSAPGTTSATVTTSGTLVAGRVSAIGDSVLLDYAGALTAAVPGTVVDASVGRQWSAGVTRVRSLRAAGELGTRVVVDLGTNGPVSTAEFDEMCTALAGVTRVVFVTVHVDGAWQAEVNAVLRAGVATHPGTALADWEALASVHPGWLYPDQTHVPIGGTGARALASLVAGVLGAN